MIHLRDPDSDTVRDTMNQILSGVRNRAALARQMGINRAMIYKWLEGRPPTIPELAEIAKATDTPIRIDLGVEEKDESDRLALLEAQMAGMMQIALSNQEAILKIIRRESG